MMTNTSETCCSKTFSVYVDSPGVCPWLEPFQMSTQKILCAVIANRTHRWAGYSDSKANHHLWNVLSRDVRGSVCEWCNYVSCVCQSSSLWSHSLSPSVDPPWNQACHQKPDYQRAAGAAWMQLPLHCRLLWGLLQRWGDQHLYGAHGERQRLFGGPSTSAHRIDVFGYSYTLSYIF